jgi:hypothetical protein
VFNDYFLLTMIVAEREAWITIKSVVTKFVGNNKHPDYVTIVTNMLDTQSLGALNELKNSFFEFALGFFFPKKSVNVYTKTLRKRKEDTKVGGMLT